MLSSVLAACCFFKSLIFQQKSASVTTSASGKLFAGEQFDTSLNQLYLRNRYYNQDVGRFTQQDTWLGIDKEPLSLNKFIYAEADPINNVDPSGNFSLGSISASSNIQGILATTAIQVPRVGFSFVRTQAGAITIVATATCAASIAASQFSITMPIAEFSRKCDGEVHRGRWQAQGGGLEESEPWNQPTPLTLGEGLALLDKLETKLRPRDRRARAQYFEQARLYAKRVALVGGISAVDFRGKSFPRGVPSSHPRVDLEIHKGRAFIPD